jgi:transcriptional regulator with XRE-family HTH domain
MYSDGMTGQQLRARRQAAGLTQVALAERLRVTSNTVARWERNEVRITEPMAMLIHLVLPKRPAGRRKEQR